MTSRYDASAVRPSASVTVEAASELVDVDSATIRRWSEFGSIDIEWRGGMEVVRLDQLHAVASASHRPEHPNEPQAALRRRLEGATIDHSTVSGLQQLARDRAGG